MAILQQQQQHQYQPYKHTHTHTWTVAFVFLHICLLAWYSVATTLRLCGCVFILNPYRFAYFMGSMIIAQPQEKRKPCTYYIAKRVDGFKPRYQSQLGFVFCILYISHRASASVVVVRFQSFFRRRGATTTTTLTICVQRAANKIVFSKAQN